MRKIAAVLLLIFAVSLLPLTVKAADGILIIDKHADKKICWEALKDALPYVEDSAALLTEGQRFWLESRAGELSEKYRCDVRIVTVDDMEDFGFRVIEEFAYYLYVEYDLGYGGGKDCVLFVLSMDGRDYDFRVWGDYAKTAFTNYGIDHALDYYILPELKINDYYSAFSALLDRAELYFDMAQDGKPFDSDTDPTVVSSKNGTKLLVTILVPLFIALIICSAWQRQMKTAKLAQTADNYIPAGGFNLTGDSDIFLYRTTTRSKIEKSSSSSSGGSSGGRGGSSGRSGKF